MINIKVTIEFEKEGQDCSEFNRSAILSNFDNFTKEYFREKYIKREFDLIAEYISMAREAIELRLTFDQYKEKRQKEFEERNTIAELCKNND